MATDERGEALIDSGLLKRIANNKRWLWAPIIGAVGVAVVIFVILMVWRSTSHPKAGELGLPEGEGDRHILDLPAISNPDPGTETETETGQ